MRKPRLSFGQILSLNAGFFGIQFSFGLQQSNMTPIYRYLGADDANLPWLWLAGPMTGLIIQPVIGAISDRTLSRWGRRRPYFLAGAIVCSLGLLAMPFSSALWMAVGLLWLLDAANNVTMEPYRAFVADRLDPAQQPLGFLMQSAFTGLAQTLAYVTPALLAGLGMNPDPNNASRIPALTIAAFAAGAAFSLGSILWTLVTTPEIGISEAERTRMRGAARGVRATLAEIARALAEMPPAMRQLAWVCLFQWYGLFCYWQYIVLSLSSSLYGTIDAAAPGFREAGLLNGRLGGFYNLVAFVAAFMMVPCARRFGPKRVHGVCLAAAGVGMLTIPLVHQESWLLLPMACIGLAWASIMGNPYLMLAGSIPPERNGVYMGIFNLFIVIPMMIQIATLPLYYRPVLGGDPRNVISLAGLLMLCAAIAMMYVKCPRLAPRTDRPAALSSRDST